MRMRELRIGAEYAWREPQSLRDNEFRSCGPIARTRATLKLGRFPQRAEGERGVDEAATSC
jgi:hypothetical protein